MNQFKNVCLVLLWALLAFRVIQMITDDRYEKSYLIMLALFAWLGGLVTNELLRLLYGYYCDWRENRVRAKWDQF